MLQAQQAAAAQAQAAPPAPSLSPLSVGGVPLTFRSQIDASLGVARPQMPASLPVGAGQPSLSPASMAKQQQRERERESGGAHHGFCPSRRFARRTR